MFPINEQEASRRSDGTTQGSSLREEIRTKAAVDSRSLDCVMDSLRESDHFVRDDDRGVKISIEIKIS